jgi:hypothetical protein
MPVKECTKGGKSGHKWGDQGVCFTGPDSKARAAEVGRAIHAQEGSKMNVAEVRSWVAQGQALLTKMEDLAGVPAPQRIKKVDEELRIVWSEVYVPEFPDTQGDIMYADEIRKMAHRFLSDGLTRQVDVNHDNRCDEVGADLPGVVVESFIAREEDALFVEDAWVVGIHVLDNEVWKAIKAGEINGFSMQANVFMRETQIELELPDTGVVEGTTAKATDPSGHTHSFRVRFSVEGEFLGGQTMSTNGGPDHRHEILATTVTERSGEGNHNHGFSVVDALASEGSGELR